MIKPFLKYKKLLFIACLRPLKQEFPTPYHLGLNKSIDNLKLKLLTEKNRTKLKTYYYQTILSFYRLFPLVN